MSFKDFNLDEDVFQNEYFSSELIRIANFYFSGTDDPVPNYKFYNHYLTNSVSGSWYVDIYDKRADDVSSNKLLSLTFGYTSSSMYFTGTGFQPTYQSQKLRMYRLFAKRLLGDEDRVFYLDNKEIKNAVFIAMSRNQYRDSMKIGDLGQVAFWGSGAAGVQTNLRSAVVYGETKKDFSGPYTYLFDGNDSSFTKNGIMYHNAGVFVLDADQMNLTNSVSPWSGTLRYDDMVKGVSGSTYNNLLWAVKHRLSSIVFNSSQKICVSFFRCTAAPNEFNYSSNPSFVDQNQQIITAISSSTPTVYFTQVKLMNKNMETIAIAKMRQPVKKHPDVGVKITVRLDY